MNRLISLFSIRGRFFASLLIGLPILLLASFGDWSRSPWVSGAASAPVSDPHTLILPLISGHHPLKTAFGIMIDPLPGSAGLDPIAQAGSTWTRHSGLLWSDVEPVEGSLQWENAAALDQQTG